MRYEEINERLARGASFHDEMLKLMCEICDTLFIISERLNGKEKVTESEVKPKKRGRPFKKGWNNAVKEGKQSESNQSEYQNGDETRETAETGNSYRYEQGWEVQKEID